MHPKNPCPNMKGRVGKGGFAEPQCFFEHRVEHRREVTGRGIDDLQHFGGHDLLFQSLARLGQKPRIFHRDDRLRGKVLKERDLLVGERPHVAPMGSDVAEQSLILAQWHHKRGTSNRVRMSP